MTEILASAQQQRQRQQQQDVPISPLSTPPPPSQHQHQLQHHHHPRVQHRRSNGHGSPSSSGGGGGSNSSTEDDDGGADGRAQHSASPRMSRKRAASTASDSARLAGLNLGTPGARKPDGANDSICLCTPAPKVPRPRNAFILYRQHHQAQVVAENPGLANPDISKIIGDKWHRESDDVKDGWKGLAEEEKQRHHQQYPDYRYQPRRGTKGPGGFTGPQGIDESGGRCPKCGGRYIATPRTPTGASIGGPVTPTAARPPPPPPIYHHPLPIPMLAPAPAPLPRPAMPLPLASPGFAAPAGSYPRRPSQAGPGPAASTRPPPHHHYQPHHQQQHHQQGPGRAADDEFDPPSPSSDLKRRRYNGTGNPHPLTPRPYPHPNMAPHAHHGAPISMSAYQPTAMPSYHGGGGRTAAAITRHGAHPDHQQPRQLSPGGPSPLHHSNHIHHNYQQHPGALPSPSALHRQPRLSGMGPPPPPPPPPMPSVVAYAAQVARGHPHFDESLRLPPLQVRPESAVTRDYSVVAAGPGAGAGAPSSTRPESQQQQQQQQQHHQQQQQSRSVEAMVMSIPPLNKLSVLRKISAPLAPPRPGSPGVETRGAVIAVEGPNPDLLRSVGAVVERTLRDSSEVALKVWAWKRQCGENGAGGSRDAGTNPHEDGKAEDRENGSREGDSKKGGSKEGGGGGSAAQAQELFASYMRTMTDWHGKSREMIRHITTRPRPRPGHNDGDDDDNENGKDDTKDDSEKMTVDDDSAGPVPVPVALVPCGFSLTISDLFASAIPITDSYAPVDHWQWMATLWRGIVGPDLVVYVRAMAEEEAVRLGAVEFKSPGVMFVRIVSHVAGDGDDKTRVARLDEKTERRLAFELMEWVRGGVFREGSGA